MINYSVLLPVYNSEFTIGEVLQRTLKTFDRLGWNAELVAVDDGSTDGSWKFLSELAKTDKRIKAIRLDKNYGQQVAVFVAMQHASGKILATLDDDLQNPPEELEKLALKLQEGYDLVYGRFRKKEHPLYRNLGTKLIGILNGMLYNKPPGVPISNFRMFSKEVAGSVLKTNARWPYVPGLILQSAAKIGTIETLHEPRRQGRSGYTAWKIMKVLFSLLFLTKESPVRLLSTLGFNVADGPRYTILEKINV